MARAIDAWQRVAKLEPSASAPRLRLAEAHHFRAQATLAKDGEPPQARGAFEAGLAAAQDAARLAAADGSQAIADEAAYWGALCQVGAAALVDHAEVVLVQSQVVDTMQRAVDAGHRFDHGGPDRYLGTYYALPLSFSERDLKRARKHLVRALEIDPAHMPSRVALARSYGIAAQDRSTFETEVRIVLEARPDDDPTRRADLQLAQAQARSLLQAAPDLFE